jgi:hypothetical protein
VGRPERALPDVSWGWLFALAAGLGLAAAAGVVSTSDTTTADIADVLPAALLGGVVALALGAAAVRVLRDQAALRWLGVPTALTIAIACGALIGITTAADASPDTTADVQQATDDAVIGRSGTPGGSGSVGSPEDRVRRDITDLQGSIVLVSGLLMLGATAVFLMRRSELRAVERNAVYLRSDLLLDDDAALARALELSLDELLAESDPRLAICAAYGTLLNELAAIGVPRYRYEGPAEHVRRTLSTYPAPADSINELLHLFEIARFSEQPITDGDALRARRVLTSTIDALAGTVS